MPPPPPPEQQGIGGNNEETANLPDDQMFEVLTRVPLDDLAACRAVSTRWCAITYERRFAPLHCRRTGAFSGYLVQSVTLYGHRADFVSAHQTNPPALSLDFVPRAPRPWTRDDVRVVAVAPRLGLACCVAAAAWRSQPRYYVCKPATRQWRALPNPRLRFPTVATAMAARRSSDGGQGAVEFRIVRLSCHLRGQDVYGSMRCEVFDSRRFAWRRVEDVPLPSDWLFRWGPAVHAHGAAHWLCCPYRDHHRRLLQAVFALDVGTGAWRLIALPREAEDATARDPWWSRMLITAVEGRLCLMVTSTDDVGREVLEVWEMASYAQARWGKKTMVSLHELKEGQGVILQHLDSSGVAFSDTGRRVMWYDLQRGKKIAQVQMSRGEVFKFESDMTPCQAMGARACQSAES